jgi:hypothetical protein
MGKEAMWPFSKTEEPPREWLTPEQAKAVTRIFYADHDANCWYACALLPSREGVRLAVSSEAEAIETATALAQEVLAKSGRTLAVEAGP